VPLISVVIPCFNSAAYLGATIAAAIAQRPADASFDVEVIVVDDGSTDDPRSVATSFADGVRYVAQPNGGVSRARNVGVTHAAGDYLCFLDADDVLAPGWFARAMREFAATPDTGAVFGQFHRWHGTATDDPAEEWARLRQASPGRFEGGNIPVRTGWIYHQMLLDSWILCSSAIVRKAFAQRAGLFEEGVPVGEDWDFWLRVSRECPVVALDVLAVLYRQHAASASRKLRQQNHAVRLIQAAIQRYGWQGPTGIAADRRAVHAALAKHSLWHAIDHFDRGSYRIGLRASLAAVRHQPGSLTHWRYLLSGLTGLGRIHTKLVIARGRR